jgi:ferredoxin
MNEKSSANMAISRDMNPQTDLEAVREEINELEERKRGIEYEIRELRKELPKIKIDPNKCVKCGNCRFFEFPSDDWEKEETGICHKFKESVEKDPNNLLCMYFKLKRPLLPGQNMYTKKLLIKIRQEGLRLDNGKEELTESKIIEILTSVINNKLPDLVNDELYDELDYQGFLLEFIDQTDEVADIECGVTDLGIKEEN